MGIVVISEKGRWTWWHGLYYGLSLSILLTKWLTIRYGCL